MFCRITELHNKEVINICDGMRLGCVDDVEVDTHTAQLTAIVLHGRPKMLGIMGCEEDIVIPWKEIEVIGGETVLVNRPGLCKEPKPRGGMYRGLFGRLG